MRVDLVIARPLPYDRYLLCSDGLSKMVGDEPLRKVLLGEQDLARAVEVLIEQANKSGKARQHHGDPRRGDRCKRRPRQA